MDAFLSQSILLLFQKRIFFWFATGVAGFCLSLPLTELMRNLLAGGRFTELGDKMRLRNDVTMGFLVELLAGIAMTRVDQFHSHLEPLRLVTDLHNQISFSYSTYSKKGEGTLLEDLPKTKTLLAFLAFTGGCSYSCSFY